MQNSFFISFEGIDGSGKSTQISLLKQYFKEKKIDSIFTSEPLGSKFGKNLASLIQKDQDPMTELLLLMANRNDHIQSTISPALKDNKWVVSDRFIDSTSCYQGILKKLTVEYVQNLHEKIIGNIYPDITFLLDLSPNEAKKRLNLRKTKSQYDNMEIKDFELIRKGFLEIAKLYPKRIKIINGELDQKKVFDGITAHLTDKIS